MLRPRRAIRGDLSFSRCGRGGGKQRLRWKIFFLPSFSHHYSIDTYNKAWNQSPGPTHSYLLAQSDELHPKEQTLSIFVENISKRSKIQLSCRSKSRSISLYQLDEAICT